MVPLLRIVIRFLRNGLRVSKSTARCLYVPMVIFLSGFLYFHAALLKVSNLPTQLDSAFTVNGHPTLRVSPTRSLFKNISPVQGNLPLDAEALDQLHAVIPRNYHGQVQEREEVGTNSSISNGNISKCLDCSEKSAPEKSVVKIQRGKRKLVKTDNLIDNWMIKNESFCDGAFTSFRRKLFFLKDVLVNRSLAHANATGGENITMVKNRAEADETYKYKKGFFTLNCDMNNKTSLKVTSKAYISAWIKSLSFTKEPLLTDVTQNSNFTIAIARYEYANVYWAVMDMYNIFLTLNSFGRTANKTHVLWVDAKPWGHLDEMWRSIFGSVTRLSQLPKQMYYKEMVWSFERINGPMLNSASNLPLHSDFRREVLKAYGLHERAEANTSAYANCSTLGRPFKVLFVWRRNYLAHPRNPSGIVARKIANEAELINATKNSLKNCDIRGVQLDLYSIKDQLELISGTDVMIGMHGAAFAFSWFLPPGSGAIELFPASHTGNWHMAHIATKNKVIYNKWKNTNNKNEMKASKMTRLPPDIIIQLIDDMIKNICHERTKPIDLNRGGGGGLLKRILGKGIVKESGRNRTKLNRERFRRRKAPGVKLNITSLKRGKKRLRIRS